MSSTFPELKLAVGGMATGAQSILTTTREGVLKLRVMLTTADDSISLLEMGGSTGETDSPLSSVDFTVCFHIIRNLETMHD